MRVPTTSLAISLALATGVAMTSCDDSGGDDTPELAQRIDATGTLSRVAITTLPGASANTGTLGKFVSADFRAGKANPPALSNSLLSSVPGAPAKPLFVGQPQGFDAILVAVKGRAGHFEVPAAGEKIVGLDLVSANEARSGEVTVLVATRARDKVSAATELKLRIDPRIFVAAGDLENHDADGSNIADLFAPFLEGNQGFPPVPEQVLDAEDNNEIEVDGVLGPPGPQDTGHREVVWDGVPRALRNRGDFSPFFFNRQNSGSQGVRGGINFKFVNGTGEEVNDALDGELPDVDAPLPGEDEDAPLGGDFSNINPKFAGNLLSFTQSAQFATRGTVITDITFNVAGSKTKGFVTGLGIVFSSVDKPKSTSVEYFDEKGRRLAKIFAPVQSKGPFPFPGPIAADKFPYSFVAFLDPTKKISRVRVTAGEIPIDQAKNDVPVGKKDVVAFDDVYYAEPRP